MQLASWLSESISDLEKEIKVYEGDPENRAYLEGQIDSLIEVEYYIANQENDIEP